MEGRASFPRKRGKRGRGYDENLPQICELPKKLALAGKRNRQDCAEKRKGASSKGKGRSTATHLDSLSGRKRGEKKKNQQVSCSEKHVSLNESERKTCKDPNFRGRRKSIRRHAVSKDGRPTMRTIGKVPCQRRERHKSNPRKRDFQVTASKFLVSIFFGKKRSRRTTT